MTSPSSAPPLWSEVRIKTARDLVLERILPCSEDMVRALAKRHGVGRLLGRTYVFTPEDVQTLLDALPRPGGGFSAEGEPAGPSSGDALAKALALLSEPRRRKRR